MNRTFIVFDLETTGVTVEEDRIIEIGFELYESFPHFLKKEKKQEWSHLVNPGIPIPKHIQELTTITDEDVKGKPLFGALAANISKGFSNCDFGGKNIRFDLQILFAEMRRNGVDWSYRGAKIVCAERIEQVTNPRTLSHLYEKYTGTKLEGAHAALNDVKASTTVLIEQIKRYQHLPHDLDQLHDLQWPGWIDAEGKFRFNKEGVPICSFGKHRNLPMNKIPNDYWKWLTKANFPFEIKELADNALKGIFPERKL